MADILERIRALAATGRILISGHAYQRMEQRNITAREVRNALTRARSAAPADDARWAVVGPSGTDDDLKVIVAIESDLIVVTVYGA